MKQTESLSQEEIISMARQAGFLTYENRSYILSPAHDVDYDLISELEAFAKLVASAASAKEREACAKLVESNADACRSDGVAQMCLYSNAAAIRQRGEA